MCSAEYNCVNFLRLIHAELITAQHVVFDKCEGLTRAGGSAKQAVWRTRFVKRFLVRIGLVVVLIALHAISGLKAHKVLPYLGGIWTFVTISTGMPPSPVATMDCLGLPSLYDMMKSKCF